MSYLFQILAGNPKDSGDCSAHHRIKMKVNSKSPARKNTHVKKTPVPTARSSTIKSTTTTTTLRTTSTTTQPKTSKRVVEAPVVKVENFSPQHEKRIASAASVTSYDLLLFSCSLLLLKSFI